MRMIEVLRRFQNVRQASDGYSALCPAHDDKTPSLSITSGGDGRTLLYCHAGCSPEEVIRAAGLKMSDLFSTDGRDRGSDGKAKTQLGPIVKKYNYQDENGELLYQVTRHDPKDFRQRRPLGNDRWDRNVKDVRRVLYRLPQLIQADSGATVYIAEGEKDVKRLTKLGLIATTNSGGAGKWRPEYNDCLEGRRVVILPDNDDAGRRHAEDVARRLYRVAKSVKIVSLPDLPSKGDVSDWLWDRGTKETLLALVEKAPEYRPARLRLRNSSKTEEKRSSVGVGAMWTPFPVEVLPEPVRSYVIEGSKALGVDPAYIGTAILPLLAAAIGNAAVIELKPGWNEPPLLWIALVAESGTLKSPVLDLVTSFTRRRQAAAVAEYEKKVQLYQAAVERHPEEMKRWKSSKSECDPPKPPEPPVLRRFYISDVTVEAVANRLEKEPKGLILIRDELAGWLGSFDQYKRGKSDAAHWLTMHGARDLLVDRKSIEQKTTFVPRAAVSIVGAITPGALRRALGEEHWENGLVARLLVSMPPRREKCWTNSVIDSSVTEAMERLFDRLYALQLPFDGKGQPQPVEFDLTGGGFRVWLKFYNEHAKLQVDATGHSAALLSKIEGAAARLALIVHLVRVAVRDPTLRIFGAIDSKSVEAGVALARWFAHEAERVYGILTETEEDEKLRTLVEWIERKGGTVSPRQLQQNLRRFRNDAEAVETALNGLVELGLGHWETTTPKTGRPGCVFRLELPPTPTEPL